MRSTALLALAALSLPLVPAAAGAQQCGPGGGWIGAAAGVSHHAVTGGVDAAEVGLDAGVRTGAVVLRASYRRILPERGEADPDAVRLRVAVPIVRLGAIGVCAVGHGGATWFSADPDEGTVLAGGAGVRVEAPLAAGRVLPFAELRGLGAGFSGELLGTDVSTSGASLGGEAGVEAGLGPVRLEAAVAVHGFDDGLGITPYPDRLFRLALGLRF